MQLQNIFKLMGFLSLLLMLSALFPACKDNDDATQGARLFMPDNLRSLQNRNGLVIRWNRSPGSAFYEVEISENSAFDPIANSETVVADSLTVRFKDLQEETTYYIRMRGLSADPALHSKYVYAEGITGKMSSFFRQALYEEMSYTYVTLRWVPEYTEEDGELQPVVTDQLVLSSPGANPIQVNLTPADLQSHSVKVENLNQGVTYIATMMNEGKAISKVTFTTPTKPAGAIEINNTQNLKSVIESAADNATIILEGGQIYNYSNDIIYLAKNITIQGAPGNTIPRVYIKEFVLGGAAALGSVNIGNITCSHIEFSGMMLSGGQEADIATVFPNEHAFGFDMPGKNSGQIRTITIGKFSLTGCTIRNFRASAVRLAQWEMHPQSFIHFNEINVENVLAYDLGRGHTSNLQSFLHLNTNSSGNDVHCARYVFKNSTFYHLNTGLIEQRKGLSTINTPSVVDIESCTFDKFAVQYPGAKYDSGTSPRYFFYFTGYDKATVSVRNSIFGQMKVSSSVLLNATSCIGAGLIFLNTYKASDGFFTDFTGAVDAGTADEIFPGRAQFNYTVSPTAIIAGAGDPRWVTE